MYALIKWYKGDPTPDEYVEVSADNPLPVTAVSGGGSQQVTTDQLPSSLDGNGNLKVAVQGSVVVQTSAEPSSKVTASGAGDVTVSPTNTSLYAISTTSSVTIILKDASEEIFSITGPGQLTFYTPLGFTTSMVLNFSGAGSAYVQYQ